MLLLVLFVVVWRSCNYCYFVVVFAVADIVAVIFDDFVFVGVDDVVIYDIFVVIVCGGLGVVVTVAILCCCCCCCCCC